MIKKLLLIFFLFLSNIAIAGDRVPAGTIIQEESYVFSINEAQKLMNEIETLEYELSKKNGIINLYIELDLVQSQQINELEELLNLRNQQILLYENWIEEDLKRIKSLERQIKITQFERWGFFTLGIVVASSSIIIADRLDDSVLENN